MISVSLSSECIVQGGGRRVQGATASGSITRRPLLVCGGFWPEPSKEPPPPEYPDVPEPEGDDE